MFLDRSKVGTAPLDYLKLSRVTETGNVIQAYAHTSPPSAPGPMCLPLISRMYIDVGTLTVHGIFELTLVYRCGQQCVVFPPRGCHCRFYAVVPVVVVCVRHIAVGVVEALYEVGLDPPVTDEGFDVIPLYGLLLRAEPQCQSLDGFGVYGADAGEPPVPPPYNSTRNYAPATN